MTELPCRLTPVDPHELAHVLAELVADVSTDVRLVAMLLAQSAGETDRWRAMRCFNFGNVKATAKWLATGGHFTYFEELVPGKAPVSENLTPKAAQVALGLSRPRPDGKAPDMIRGALRGDGRHYCEFWPRHPQAMFRAHESLRDGAAAWLSTLRGRYRLALERGAQGDVAGYVRELAARGYFTDDEDHYRAGVASLYAEFLPVARAALRARAAPTVITSPRTEDNMAYATRIDDIGFHPSGWSTLSSGLKVANLPLVDNGNRGPLFCRGLDTAKRWLAARGKGERVAEVDELRELIAAGLWTPPVILPDAELRAAGFKPGDPAMSSATWCERHDRAGLAALAAAGWDGVSLAAVLGKYQAADGWMLGWPLGAGDPESKWVQQASPAHVGYSQLDYATLIRVVCDDEPSGKLWLEGVEDTAKTLALRCLAWTGYQLGLGVAEIPGARHDPRILAYSRYCRRGGRFLGVDAGGMPLWDGGAPLPLPRDEDAWCAASASACLAAALLPGEEPPHGLRVSVRELCEDARATGRLRALETEPRPGWLAIEGRAGENPLHGGRGHVRRVELVEAERYYGLGGNEGDAWGKGWWPRGAHLRADGHRTVGWIKI